jgi:hypothetical protein
MSEQWYLLMTWSEGRRKNHFFGEKGELCGHRSQELERGTPVDRWDGDTACLKSESAEFDGEPDDLLANVFHLETVFSERLRFALDAQKIGRTDIQHLPVRVFRSTGEDIKGYTIGNVIARIAALDYEASEMLELHQEEIDPLTGRLRVRSLWHEALRRDKLGGHDVIRLLEFSPPIFVSDRFKQVYEENRCTGATFKKVIMT